MSETYTAPIPGMPRRVRSGHVAFHTAQPKLYVVAMLNGEAPRLSGGKGGWEETARNRRTAVSEWRGHGLQRLSVPVMLDGWIDRRSVSKGVADLDRMGVKPRNAMHPPIVRVSGAMRGTDLQWVVEDIAWEEELRDDASGVILRAAGVVTLMQYLPGMVLATARKPGKPVFQARHTARQGDTLRTISMLFYGNVNGWTRIRNANPKLKSAKALIAKGTTVVIPL